MKKRIPEQGSKAAAQKTGQVGNVDKGICRCCGHEALPGKELCEECVGLGIVDSGFNESKNSIN